jgi:Fe-S-cluster containining protein
MKEEFDVPFKSEMVPAKLELGSRIQFRCHKGISCFNACCKQADITLTPYDVLRLKDHLGMSSTEFLKAHTVPFQMDQDGLPGIKLRTDEEGACLFVTEEGCSVYKDRPTACRYYPVGHMAMRRAGVSEDETHYFLVTEDHCKGHEEDRELTIQEYLGEQEIAAYANQNQEWLQIMLKKRSAGPSVGRPPESSLQFFFMCSYDIDRFRRFVLSDNFRNTYELEEAVYKTFESEDLSLLQFGFKLMRQVFFGERSIPEKNDAWEKRVEERQDLWEARRQIEIARKQQEEDDRYK